MVNKGIVDHTLTGKTEQETYENDPEQLVALIVSCETKSYKIERINNKSEVIFVKLLSYF